MAISDWADMMGETISHKAVTSRDIYGKPIYGTATNYSAYISRRSQRVVSQRQDIMKGEVLAAGYLIINGTADIGLDDEISQSGVSLGIILRVDRPADEKGVHHTKIYFGAA